MSEPTEMFEWQDSREVKFDGSVLFSNGYDFDGWESFRREYWTPVGKYAVWPEHDYKKTWSAYGGPMGRMSVGGFENESDARAAVMAWAVLDATSPLTAATARAEKAEAELANVRAQRAELEDMYNTEHAARVRAEREVAAWKRATDEFVHEEESALAIRERVAELLAERGA